jgi:hypothetical protein
MHRPGSNWARVALLVAGVAIVGALDAPAGPAGNVKPGVAASGAIHATGGSYRMRGTVGQAVAGKAGTMGIGFWYAVRGIGVVAVEPVPTNAPLVFRLDQNVPNPVHGRTSFAFALPRDLDVALTIYDVRGRAIARLVDGPMPAGEHRVALEPNRLASGTYFYVLRAGEHVASKRFVVLN